MEFGWFLCFLKFVVRVLGQFFGCDVCLWLQRFQGSRVFEKLAHFLSFIVKDGFVTTKAT